MATVDIPDVELEETCYYCNGTGIEKRSSPPKPCENCKGFGSFTTQFGDKVLDFVARRFNIKLPE